eukprot:CAMPEP_0202722864 /NCGR_PEP_ID=MMETSP1385-20130828/161158_1 /ASSEMBLY_ACC=CAM_ASM_000861 /TAXON_ID=933848 /ORGANISM="Elphidium margaritaceum" /LENGTH=210 /DNA_ID=CAMNT_0049387747 /DNA_START=44 /DNA_END=676 /DNA_ORIENTATION=-
MSTARPQYTKNETVYIRNLNEKLSKQELRTCLYLFFSQFGEILDLVALKTPKMRGQAFIVFKDVRTATKAVDGANNRNFFGQCMDVSFAKTKSKKLLEFQGKTAQAIAIGKKSNAYHFGKKSDHKQQNGNNEHSRLRLENVPINPNIEEMEKIFAKFMGFIRIIYDTRKPGLCFAEYSNQTQSMTALEKLQGLDLNGSSLRITVDNFQIQ